LGGGSAQPSPPCQRNLKTLCFDAFLKKLLKQQGALVRFTFRDLAGLVSHRLKRDLNEESITASA
jgi:hypothetical protein